MAEKASGITFDELNDALRAEGMGESSAEFHDILLSLEEEGLIESKFAAPSRLYYPKKESILIKRGFYPSRVECIRFAIWRFENDE